MLRHSSKTVPASARVKRTRVLVKKSHTARTGGNCALADFKETPPFGISMVGYSGSPRGHADPIQKRDIISVAREAF